MNVAEWVNGARRSAGLSQRQLADNSGIPQPTIARIESGKQMPRADTLDRLLRACGWELDMTLRRGLGEDRSLIRSWLALTPEERAERGAAYGRFADQLRRGRPGRATCFVTRPFEPLRALRVLDRHAVRYIVIGGFAGDPLGAPLNTNDLDICYERTPPNMERLAAALAELKATLRVAGVEEDPPFILDANTLAAGDSFTFETDAGSLDVLGTPPGTAGFTDLSQRAHTVPIGDVQILVVDLADLMRMKRASGRVKDRMHLEVLSALRDDIAGVEDAGG